MSRRTPRFIAIEGLDGSGKSTLAQHLAESVGALLLQTPDGALREARVQVEATFGAGSQALTLFYAAAVLAASERARRVLQEGRAVVVDRYWSSTLAYAVAAGREVDLAGIEPLLLPADLTVFLHVDRQVRAARLRARGPLSEHDLMSLDPYREASLLAAYRAMSQHRVVGHHLWLDATGSRTDQVATAVRQGVRP
jgi:dTMP kinase